jgi:putative tricarboxylic transport membrane protein
MDALQLLLHGLAGAVTPENLLYCFLGALVGTVVGVIPGLGPITAIALLIPLSFGLEPVSALILMSGIYYGAMYGGSITSVLINTPGEVANAVTAIDGYQMAKNGKAGAALATSAVGSFVGGIFAMIGLVLMAPLLTKIAVSFAAAEYTVLLVGALLLTATMMSSSLLKSMISLTIGMAIGMIGIDSQTAVPRWTFGNVDLSEGINIAIAAMALFAIPEALRHLAIGAKSPNKRFAMQGAPWMRREEFKRSLGPYGRGSIVGFIAGLLPGLGPTVGTFASYSVEKRWAKKPYRDQIGRGAIEGVAGPETANNAGAGGAMIPMLTLGVPATATTALLLFVFQMYGLQPGPQLFSDDPDLVWTIIASLLIGNAMLLALNLPLVKVFVNLLKIPPPILYAGVLMFTVLGAWATMFSAFSLILLLAIALLGYFMEANGFPLAPAILAVVLVPLLEDNLRRALAISDGNYLVFIERPISGTIVGVLALLLVVSGLRIVRRNRTRGSKQSVPA